VCGRFVNFLQERDIIDTFAIAEVANDVRLLPPSWNIAPTQRAPIVTLAPGGSTRRLEVAHWGLIPAWATDLSIGSRMFNARSETLVEKPSFRSAFEKRRCLVPANGYYEWQRQPDGKQPYFIHPTDDRPLAFAGLWETREDGEDRSFSFTIVTRASTGDLATIHDRQPVMLRDDAREAWMDTGTSPDELLAVLRFDGPGVEARPVSPAVGNVRNNEPSLIEPVGDAGVTENR
jgi:putative SOS response-associated peptidase YedK